MKIDLIQSKIADRLVRHGSTGTRTSLSGIVDMETLEKQQYAKVLEAVDDRLTKVRYTLFSMVLAGIYFGLLVGLWLVDFSSWESLLKWTIPVVLVTIYGTYSTHQTATQIRHLSETRALLALLVEESSREPDRD